MVISKRMLSILTRLIISIILLFLFFKFNHIDIPKLSESIKHTDKLFLALAFFAYFFNHILCFYRWKMLLKALDINLPSNRLIRAFCGGIFFSLFLPSSIGGDLARSIDLSTHTKRPKEVVATVFLDRLSGYVGLVIIVLSSLFIGRELIKADSLILVSISVITAVLIVILLVLFNKFFFLKVNKFLDSSKAGKIREAIKNLHEEMHIFKHHRKVILKNLLVSLLIQIISPVTFYITALSLGIKGDITYFFIFIPIISAITLLPISLGGFGIRENTTVILFSKAGIDQNYAGAIAILNSFFILLYGLIGGLIYYVLTIHYRRIQYRKSSVIPAKA